MGSEQHPSRPAPSIPAPAPFDPDAKTILVVDDSATMRSVMSVYLMGRGFNLIMADDGERALRLLRLMTVDLVIADVNMPNMDGMAFLQQVRADTTSRIAKVPVVLMTGAHDPELDKRALLGGVDAFLRKPLDSTMINGIVDRLLGDQSTE